MQIIDIDGVELHYDVQGSGRPLILMHGWGCSHQTVESIARVAAKTHTVYNVDFPGFGASPEPDEVWGIEQYTRLIEKFAGRLGLESPVLVGHSFGGRVGILMSSRTPVSKLILVDAAGIKPRHGFKWHLKVKSFKAGKWVIKTFYPDSKIDAAINRWRKRFGSSDFNNASPKMRAIMSKVVNEDLKSCLPLISAPTLLVWGENDTATPIADARIMEKTIPDAGLVSFAGCGHYSFLDNPSGFAAVLSSFLKS